MNITEFVISHREKALLIGDYHTYHAQLTRRLASIRKKLGRATKKNAKFEAKARVTAEDIGRNHEFVHLLLLTAERAYAHAMSMKSNGTDDAAGTIGSTRRHIVTRINKAAKQAEYLAELLSNESISGASDTDILEAKAYYYSLSGAEEFEKHATGQRSSDREIQRQKWHECLINYSTARVIYVALLKSTKKDVYKELLAGTVDPSIRFAAYQSHIPRTLAVSTISRKFFPLDDADLVHSVTALDDAALEDEQSGSGDSTGSADIPSTITWRGRKANIIDASIGQALATVNGAEQNLATTLFSHGSDLASTRERGAAYDEVLIAAQDAADATRRAIEEHEKEKIPEADHRMQDLRVTNLAVAYDLISWRVGRNRVLIGRDDGVALDPPTVGKAHGKRKDGKEWVEKPEGNSRKLAKLRERCVLYDAILQSIDSVKEVPGAVRDETFVRELDGGRAYFQALKCLNIANSHTLLSSHRDALALLLRASALSSKASSSLSSSSRPANDSVPRLAVSQQCLESLDTHLHGLTLFTRALVELYKHNENSATAAKKGMISAAPVVDTLNEYPASGEVDLGNLVAWPPMLRPVPIKPLFLDLSWNYIEYEGFGKADTKNEERQVDSTKSSSTEEKKKGWFGFGR